MGNAEKARKSLTQKSYESQLRGLVDNWTCERIYKM